MTDDYQPWGAAEQNIYAPGQPGGDPVPEDPGWNDVIPPGQPGGDLVPDSDTLLPQDSPAREGSPADEIFTHRDPAEVADDVSHGFTQSAKNTCAPSAVTMVLSDFYDIKVDSEAEVTQWASENQLLTDNGMGINGIVALLDHYGVPAHEAQGTVQELDRYLDEGRAVILAVDASEYWNDPTVPDNSGHAVRIVDIDLGRGIATLTDSGVSNGSGLEVPLADLEKAWADEGHEMVVTDEGESDAAGKGTTATPSGQSGGAPASDSQTPVDTQPTETRAPMGIPGATDLTGDAETGTHGLVIIPGVLTMAGLAAIRAATRTRRS